MLQMTPRAKIASDRFPPLPFFSRRQKISEADRRVIRLALEGGGVELPTDLPDLCALVELLEETHRPLPDGLRGRRRRESAA